MSKDSDLTDKQRLFCQEYMVDLNATQAAIRAGYSEKTAKEIGYENLTKPHIIELISELQNKRSNKVEVTAEKVLKELAKIAFSDIRQFYNEDGSLKCPHELNDEAASLLSSMESEELFGVIDGSKCEVGKTKKIKMWDKMKALELIGKHIGFYEKDNTQKPIVSLPTLKVEIVPPTNE